MITIAQKRINILVIIALVSAFTVPSVAAAQTTPAANPTAVPAGQSEFVAGTPVNPTYTLLTSLPCIPSTSSGCTNGSMTSVNIQTYVVYVFKLMIALAVFAAVVMCIIGGFQYMLSESVLKKEDAKETIKNAVLGLTGALLSWLILYTINPNLVNVSLVTVPKLNVQTTNINLNTPTIPTRTQALNSAATALNQSQLQNQTVAAGVAAANQTQAAQTQADSFSQQLDDNNCDPSDTTPPCSTLEQQYETAQNQADLYTSQATTQSAINSMSNAATTFEETNANQHAYGVLGGTTYNVGGTDINAAQSALTSINATYDQSYSQIENGDVADRQLLTNQKTYQDATVIQDYNANTVVQNLTQDQNILNQPNNPADIAAAQSLIKNLQANQIPVQLDGAPVTGIGNLNNNPTLSAQYAADNQARICKIQAALGSACATSK